MKEGQTRDIVSRQISFLSNDVWSILNCRESHIIDTIKVELEEACRSIKRNGLEEYYLVIKVLR